MPKASLPTTPKGWTVALISSFVGFISGYIVLKWLGDKWK